MEKEKTNSSDNLLSVEFEVTPIASQKIQAIIEKENKVGFGLRIRAASGGCSGTQYQLGLDEKESEGDAVLLSNGVKVFIDPESQEVIQAGKLDYIEGPQGSGFKITATAEAHGGGCGSHGGGGGCGSHDGGSPGGGSGNPESGGCGSGGCGCHH